MLPYQAQRPWCIHILPRPETISSKRILMKFWYDDTTVSFYGLIALIVQNVSEKFSNWYRVKLNKYKMFQMCFLHGIFHQLRCQIMLTWHHTRLFQIEHFSRYYVPLMQITLTIQYMKLMDCTMETHDELIVLTWFVYRCIAFVGK